MKRLYERGEENLEKEMDIVKIVRNLRNLKIFIKKYIVDEETLEMIKHSDKNIIHIDSTSEESSSSSSSSKAQPVQMKELVTQE